MLISTLLGAFLAGTVAAQSDSEVVAVFLLGRHGDRTSKIQGIGVEGSSVLTTRGKESDLFCGDLFPELLFGIQ